MVAASAKARSGKASSPGFAAVRSFYPRAGRADVNSWQDAKREPRAARWRRFNAESVGARCESALQLTSKMGFYWPGASVIGSLERSMSRNLARLKNRPRHSLPRSLAWSASSFAAAETPPPRRGHSLARRILGKRRRTRPQKRPQAASAAPSSACSPRFRMQPRARPGDHHPAGTRASAPTPQPHRCRRAAHARRRPRQRLLPPLAPIAVGSGARPPLRRRRQLERHNQRRLRPRPRRRLRQSLSVTDAAHSPHQRKRPAAQTAPARMQLASLDNSGAIEAQTALVKPNYVAASQSLSKKTVQGANACAPRRPSWRAPPIQPRPSRPMRLKVEKSQVQKKSSFRAPKAAKKAASK